MENEGILKEHRGYLHKLILKQFLPATRQSYAKLGLWTENYVQQTHAFFSKLDTFAESQDKIRIIHEHILFRKIIIEGLNNWINTRHENLTDTLTQAYDKEIGIFVKEQPSYWIQKQKRERFIPLEEDSKRVAFFKLLKRTGYALHCIPKRLSNRVRSMLKKPPEDLPVWKQKIPVEKLTRWYYENEFLERYFALMENTLKDTAILANELWKMDHALYTLFNDFVAGKMSKEKLTKEWEEKWYPAVLKLKRVLHEREQLLEHQIMQIIAEVDKLFDSQLDIAGTLEFTSFLHREKRRRSNYNNTRKSFIARENKRHNTLYVLADDWKFNQEIYILKDVNRRNFLMFRSRLLSKADIVNKSFKKIPVVLEATLSNIVEDLPDNFRKNLQQLKYSTGKSLNTQVIPEISDLMLEQGFPVVIDEIEQNLHTELSSLTSRRILIDGFDPATGYSDKSMQSISPLELVEFEMMSDVRKVMLHSKTFTIERLERIKTELDNLGRMVVFNLDSVIAMLDEQGSKGMQDCFIDAKASMERALQNYANIQSLFDDFITDLQQQTDNVLSRFSSQLTELTDNSRVADIRYRITRAKALKKSEQIWLQMRDYSGMLFLKSKLWYQVSSRKIGSSIESIKSQLGIHTIPRDITFEISDYLVSGDTTVKNLPFVYRRLFINEPLKDSTFYLQRKDEFIKLQKAYDKWKMGSFAPVLIFGEKGSGISSFVHIFVKEKIRHNPVVYSVLPVKRIQSDEDLLALLGLSFRAEAFLNLNELYEFVEKQESFVVYLDKLHLLYLRQTGGFNILKKFFEIISSTSKKVFWICTCGIFASQYLDKAIGLYDYFPVLIGMKNLSKEEVRNMIMLRHKASGYDLFFKPSRNDLADRAFLKKSKNEQQEYLKEKYFEFLNRLTRSNIAFALQLWSRSAEKAEDNVIILHSLENLDFSFMFNLPAEVIFGLHALILHERLDVFQLSQVLNISRRQAYLLLMRLTDRGIIKEEKGHYAIHQLLYRQTVLLLQDKNML